MTTQTNLKDDYLSEMGISQWYPRARLINALAPLQRIEQEPKAKVKSHEVHQSNNVGAVAKEDSIVVALDELKSELNPTQLVVSNTETVRQSVNLDPVENARFGLGIYVVGEYIVASSLTSQHEALQDQAWRLMQNILRSIRANDYPLVYHHSIFWPFFQNKNADQSLHSAQEYVEGFLGHLFEQYKVSKIIAFRGVLPKLKRWSPNSDTYNAETHLVLPSLYKMLNDPTEKAKAWQLIQASPFR